MPTVTETPGERTPATKTVSIDDVTGVCDDESGPVVHLLDELAAGLGTLADLANHTDWEGEPPHVMLFALERKARGALALMAEGSRARTTTTIDALDALDDVAEDLGTIDVALSRRDIDNDEAQCIQASLGRIRSRLTTARNQLAKETS